MKFIKDIVDGDNLSGIYYVPSKKELKTKTDKNYYSIILQDKTGTLECKIWDIYSSGIGDFENGDFVEVQGTVQTYNGALQGVISRTRKCIETEYDIGNYMPVSEKNIDDMYNELLEILDTVKTPYFKKLLDAFFKNPDFEHDFKKHSAAKTVHHAFIGGLLEHSLSVTKICRFIVQIFFVFFVMVFTMSAITVRMVVVVQRIFTAHNKNTQQIHYKPDNCNQNRIIKAYNERIKKPFNRFPNDAQRGKTEQNCTCVTAKSV